MDFNIISLIVTAVLSLVVGVIQYKISRRDKQQDQSLVEFNSLKSKVAEISVKHASREYVANHVEEKISTVRHDVAIIDNKVNDSHRETVDKIHGVHLAFTEGFIKLSNILSKIEGKLENQNKE